MEVEGINSWRREPWYWEVYGEGPASLEDYLSAYHEHLYAACNADREALGLDPDEPLEPEEIEATREAIRLPPLPDLRTATERMKDRLREPPPPPSVPSGLIEFPLGPIGRHDGEIKVARENLVFERSRPLGTKGTVRERIYLYSEGIYYVVTDSAEGIHSTEPYTTDQVRKLIGEEQAEKVLKAARKRYISDWWDESNRRLTWCGCQYKFTRTQAPVVAMLWRAHQDGLPDVADVKLLEASGSDQGRLRDVFRGARGKRHPAWGKAIVQSESRGYHRLQSVWE